MMAGPDLIVGTRDEKRKIIPVRRTCNARPARGGLGGRIIGRQPGLETRMVRDEVRRRDRRRRNHCSRQGPA